MALSSNQYGTSRIRLLRVERHGDRHDLKDLTAQVEVEGDFAAAHIEGDNRNVTATDTIVNTVYALARGGTGELEEFGQRLVSHFLRNNPAIHHVRATLREPLWARIPVGGKPAGSSFLRESSGLRVATVRGKRADDSAGADYEATIHAGIEDLPVLKTSHSAYENFRDDVYTTLQDKSDVVLATAINATWLYSHTGVAFSTVWHGVRHLILEIFAQHESKSLQHTLYSMGETILGSFDDMLEIHLSMPLKHLQLVDLERFNLRNENEIFAAAEEPAALIEATIRR